MFTRSAAFYDAIYAFKDYQAEAELVMEWAARHGWSEGGLLDMACGTGRHAQYFARKYQVTGVDLDRHLLEQARQRLPEARFLQGDMCTVDLGQQFEVVTCLFSAIGYLSDEQLPQACANFYRHLKPGGVLLVEPWLRPDMIRPGHVGVDRAEVEGAQVVRMSRLQLEGRLSICQFQYLIGTSQGIRHEAEDHRLTLFSLDEYRAGIEQAGLRFQWDEPRLTGRGLLVGVKD
ncbi:class I SAM-dependent methyltransferase [bacterium]|nr:class I SAM-dependent methyltransferase [bacterium]